MFHKHRWGEVRRKFIPPPTRHIKINNGTMDMIQTTTFGFTVIELKCDSCGDIKTYTEYGDIT